MIRIIIMAIFLQSCSSELADPVFIEIDDRLVEHVLSFRKRMIQSGTENDFDAITAITMKYINKKNWLGYCNISSTGIRFIVVSESVKSDCKIKHIVYHELGHCALNLGHVDNPFDIMNSYAPNECLPDFVFERSLKRIMGEL